MDLSKLPKITGSDLPKNVPCLVWRHARWFVAIENDTHGAMFPLKPTEQTEVEFYPKGKWGYPTDRLVITKKQGGKQKAVEIMEAHLV